MNSLQTETGIGNVY